MFPRINIQKRDRFSKLSFQPKNTLSKLKARTAIVAFNINSVYEIAETIRQHKGGAAVVLGSMSPRTRNAQVEIYEEKKVDFLVATDAIGMGLNLNINHIVFSSLQKYDGRHNRDLSPAELGQIAGRAGRYQNDGSFGFLKSAGKFDPFIINLIENHNFEIIKKIYWRNSNIDFSSVNSVINSLKEFPVKNFFIHKKNAEDEVNFKTLSKDAEVNIFLNNQESILLLWNVCQIPDFQKIFKDSYQSFLKNIFLTLIKNNRILPDSWLSDKIIKLDNYDGGIEELSIKISNIRKWTFIANHSEWIKESQFWQEKTHQIENNLSDHLHTSLTNRFIDFSASFFTSSLNQGEKVEIKVDKDNFINLNGQNYGYINGFNLELNVPNTDSLFALKNAKKSIRNMIEEKINDFLSAPLDTINLGNIQNLRLNDSIKILWGNEPIGKIEKGLNISSPKALALNTEYLDSNKKVLVSKKLQLWLDETILSNLKTIKESIDEDVPSEVRAIIYNVFENLGTMLINDHLETTKNLKVKDKIIISHLGIRIGAKYFFMPNLLKKFPMELNAVLWKVFNDFELNETFPLPLDGRVSFEKIVNMPETYWSAIGYKYLNGFAVRIDVFERIFFIARKKIKYGPFLESADMMNPIGCNSDQLEKILKFCGFDSLLLEDEKKLYFFKVKNQKEIKTRKIIKNKIYKIAANQKKKTISLNKKIKQKKKSISLKKNTEPLKEVNKPDPNSPFAVLEKLL